MRNYLAEMLYALTSAYSRKDYDNHQQGLPLETNIGKLFSILAYGLDSVQEQAELIKLWDDIDSAQGTVLDRHGANFGVKRVSSDDRFYRLAIKVKIIAQLSGGDTDTVIQATGDLLNVSPTDVLFEDVFPAKIALYVDQTLVSQDRLDLIEPIALAIKRLLAAGIGMRLYMRTYRTYRNELSVLRCGYESVEVWAVPVGQNRESIKILSVNNASFARSDFDTVPTSQDRVAKATVSLAQGAVQTPRVYSPPPDVNGQHSRRQEAAGGAIYHTHIKSQRVD